MDWSQTMAITRDVTVLPGQGFCFTSLPEVRGESRDVCHFIALMKLLTASVTQGEPTLGNFYMHDVDTSQRSILVD